MNCYILVFIFLSIYVYTPLINNNCILLYTHLRTHKCIQYCKVVFLNSITS